MKQKENTTKKIEKLNVLTGLKSKILDILKKHNVIRAGIFGSFARGEQKKNSDIDILIEFEGKKSLFDLVELKLELEDRLNKKVDIITYKSINSLLKKIILNEEVKILWKNDNIYSQHILDSINEIEKSTKDISENNYKENKDIQDATIRRIEVIGEAVKNLSPVFKKKYSEIEWRKIAGTRDVLIHSYFSVDIDLLWEIVEKDLHLLKKNIVYLIKKEKE